MKNCNANCLCSITLNGDLKHRQLQGKDRTEHLPILDPEAWWRTLQLSSEQDGPVPTFTYGTSSWIRVVPQQLWDCSYIQNLKWHNVRNKQPFKDYGMVSINKNQGIWSIMHWSRILDGIWYVHTLQVFYEIYFEERQDQYHNLEIPVPRGWAALW